MPHIKSNVNLEQSFGKFSTSYLSESKRLEMNIQRDTKAVQILGILAIGAWIISLTYSLVSLYTITHLNGTV